MTINTVFFDMGGTIDTYWYSPEMRLSVTCDLQKYLTSLGIHLHLNDVQLYETITNGLNQYHQWRLVSLDELPASEVWQNYILSGFSNIPSIEEFADDLMVWIETHYYQRTMRPEIPSVLQAIQEMGYKIGLISNVNSRGQVPLNLCQYGIKQYFNPIVLSSEYLRRKPDPSIFHYAARLSNTPTSECIYIGDRISRDVLGAQRAGFKLAIQIRHDFIHGEVDEGATPDLFINNMTELLDILQRDQQSKKVFPVQEYEENKIKAVLFDADGILYYRKNKDQEVKAFIKKFGNKGAKIADTEIQKLRHKAFIGQINFEQYKTEVFKLYGITDPSLIAGGVQKALSEKEDISFFNDISETLQILKDRNFYLGIITDTAQPLHAKLNKLERGGIGHFWDSIIPSSEVGVQKPDPKIYQLALQQLNIKPGQAVFVGHKTSELAGATNSGLQTIAFNHDDDANADYFIENFSDLVKLPILN